MKKKSERVYVLHWTLDCSTGEELVGGCRYKNISGLTYEGSMRIGFRKVAFYHRDTEICGRMCRIFYATAKRCKENISYSYVTEEGRKYGFRAEYLRKNDRRVNYRTEIPDIREYWSRSEGSADSLLIVCAIIIYILGFLGGIQL